MEKPMPSHYSLAQNEGGMIMSIKPILFSTPMVQAILEGRKTMTRRVVKPQPRPENSYFGGEVLSTTDKKLIGCVGFCRSALAVSDHDYAKPKYHPGDILWVRETWMHDEYEGFVDYKADFLQSEYTEHTWRPSIFMPKAAARIWLKVTDVKCERVQQITGDDCRKEGMHATLDEFYAEKPGFCGEIERNAFEVLWDHLNAKRGYAWDSNPWVFVISFTRITKEELDAQSTAHA